MGPAVVHCADIRMDGQASGSVVWCSLLSFVCAAVARFLMLLRMWHAAPSSALLQSMYAVLGAVEQQVGPFECANFLNCMQALLTEGPA